MTEWPPALVVRDWSTADAAVVAGWRYGDRWSVYDHRADVPAPDARDRRTVVSAVDGAVIGFYCVGDDARVPGLTAEDGLVDLGLGMTPDLVGRGHGEQFARAVLDDVGRRLPRTPQRAVIQAWNTRSLTLAGSLGFGTAGMHRCVQGGRDVAYIVLIRDPER